MPRPPRNRKRKPPPPLPQDIAIAADAWGSRHLATCCRSFAIRRPRNKGATAWRSLQRGISIRGRPIAAAKSTNWPRRPGRPVASGSAIWNIRMAGRGSDMPSQRERHAARMRQRRHRRRAAAGVVMVAIPVGDDVVCWLRRTQWLTGPLEGQAEIADALSRLLEDAAR